MGGGFESLTRHGKRASFYSTARHGMAWKQVSKKVKTGGEKAIRQYPGLLFMFFVFSSFIFLVFLFSGLPLACISFAS